ncbi:zeta toxin family protein [Streptomyces sp. NPDC001591]|uniref:zeta toxin family protein n=1 Tax=Streptomyces sp. NPDC001591 TaxID=3364589 RepID=UPI00368EE2A4
MGRPARRRPQSPAWSRTRSTAKVERVDQHGLLPHHPEYARWQAERPEEADALVCPDGDRRWEQAQKYVLARGFDVLLESAMASPAEFEDSAGACGSPGCLAALPRTASRSPSSQWPVSSASRSLPPSGSRMPSPYCARRSRATRRHTKRSVTTFRSMRGW